MDLLLLLNPSSSSHRAILRNGAFVTDRNQLIMTVAAAMRYIAMHVFVCPPHFRVRVESHLDWFGLTPLLDCRLPVLSCGWISSARSEVALGVGYSPTFVKINRSTDHSLKP